MAPAARADALARSALTSTSRTNISDDSSFDGSSPPRQHAKQHKAHQQQQQQPSSSSAYHPFEGLDPITPIAVYSERDLQREVELMRLGFEGKEDWQGWIGSLQKLAGVASGGLSADPALSALYVSLLRNTLQGAVATRVCDLRSAVVREACRAVAVAACALGAAFAPLADLWLPPLLKNTVTSKEVISASGHEALCALLTAAPQGFPRLIPQLLEGMSAKAAPVRHRCMKYLLLVASRWADGAQWTRSLTAFADSVKRAVTDADPGARTAARQTYCVLRRRFPAAADKVISGLDATVQRHLSREEKSFDVDAAMNVQQVCSTAAVAAAAVAAERDWHEGDSGELTAAAMPALPARTVVQRLHATHHRSAAVTAVTAVQSSTPQPATATATAAATAAAAAPVRSEGERTTGSSNRPSAILRGAVRVGSSGNSSGAVGSGASPVATGNNTTPGSSSSSGLAAAGGAQRLAPHNEQQQMQMQLQSSDAAAIRLHAGAQRVTRPRLGGAGAVRESSTAAAVSATSVPAGAVRVARRVAVSRDTDAHNNNNSSSSAANSSSAAAAAATAVVHPLRVSRNDAPVDYTTSTATAAATVDGTAVSSSSSDRREVQHHAEQLLDSAAAHSSGGDWDSRVRSWDALRRLLTEEGSAGAYLETRAASRKLLPQLGDGIDDPHYRVAIASLCVLTALAAAHPAPLAPALGPLLPRVFARLTEAKEEVRSVAGEALNACRRAYAPAALCAALCPRVADPASERARAGLLEFIAALVPHSGAYFSAAAQYGHTRAFVQRVTSLLTVQRRGGGGSSERSAAVTALTAVYQLEQAAFVSVAAQLSPEALLALRRALSSTVPELEARVNANVRAAHAEALAASSSSAVAAASLQHAQQQQQQQHVIQAAAEVAEMPVAASPVQHSPQKQLARHLLVRSSPVSQSPAAVPAATSVAVPAAAAAVVATVKQSAAVTMSPAMWHQDPMPQLLSDLSPAAAVHSKVQALKSLKIVTAEAGSAFWSRYFGQILILLLEGCGYSSSASTSADTAAAADSDDKENGSSSGSVEEAITDDKHASSGDAALQRALLRVKYLQAVRELALAAPLHAAAAVESILPRLLQCGEDQCELVRAEAAAVAAATLLPVVHPVRLLACLAPSLSGSMGARREALRLLCAVVPRLGSPALLAELNGAVLMSKIEGAFIEGDLGVRQLAVRVLVETYQVLGEALLPFIASMPRPRLKLITIYIEKRSKEGGKAAPPLC
jgi:trimeric autotransporter adhesin